MKPRPYQEDLHVAIANAIRAGYRSILVRLPTGGGKTFIGGRLMAGAERKGNRSVFLAPRRELVYQTADLLKKLGIAPGLIMAGEPMHQHRFAQVASFDTLHARAMKRNTINLPRAKLVIPDEAHLSLADTRVNIIRAFGEDAIIVALTATPARGDGRPLGDLYDHMILGWNERRMMDEGYLVDCKYYAPSKPDLRKVKTRAGDWEITGLEHEMNKPAIVGSVVKEWLRLAENRPTVTFCVTRSHGRHVTEAFLAAGVAAEYVDGETPEGERRSIFERVERGDTRVLVNVFVASYGLDIPPLAVCQLARPTKSLVLYKQMGGRVLRPVYADWATPEMLEESAEMRLAAIADSDKPYAMLIDHAGAIDLHGYLDEDAPWTLEGEETITEARERERKEREAPKEITCPKCKTVFKGSRFCPGCGFQLLAPGEPIPVHKAELEEKVPGGNKANRKTPWDEKARFHAEAKGWAKSKGHKDGVAAHLYKEKFGVWPNDGRVRDVAPAPPTSLIKGFLQHRAIKRKHSARV